MGDLRRELAAYGRRLVSRGLVAGTGGNLSARDGRVAWISPSGVALEDLSARILCRVDIESGRQLEGRMRPSSETRMHLEIYRECGDAVACIFHTHSPWASGVISSRGDVRPMFAEVVVELGEIAVVPYHTPGSAELAAVVRAAVAGGAETVFLVNHGVVALGRSLRQAYYRCCVAEDAARSYIAAVLAGGPRFLSDEEAVKLKKMLATEYRRSLIEK